MDPVAVDEPPVPPNVDGGPVVLVPPGTQASARHLATRAGWRPVPALPDEPWDLHPLAPVVVIDASTAEGTDEVLAEALVAAARGAAVVLTAPSGGSWRARLVAAARRVGGAVCWDAQPLPALRLRVSQIDLLWALSSGSTVSDAAARVGVSLRTAHRLLAGAREALGVTGNGHAASSVLRAVGDLSGELGCEPAAAELPGVRH